MFYLYVNKCCPKQLFVEIFSPAQTANVAYFQRKIPLSLFSVYPAVSLSQFIRISGVQQYLILSKCA